MKILDNSFMRFLTCVAVVIACGIIAAVLVHGRTEYVTIDAEVTGVNTLDGRLYTYANSIVYVSYEDEEYGLTDAYVMPIKDVTDACKVGDKITLHFEVTDFGWAKEQSTAPYFTVNADTNKYYIKSAFVHDGEFLISRLY